VTAGWGSPFVGEAFQFDMWKSVKALAGSIPSIRKGMMYFVTEILCTQNLCDSRKSQRILFYLFFFLKYTE
jgi:hypothetical protein